MKPDVIEQFGKSTIQHGKYNDRIYLMKAASEDTLSLPSALKEMASRRGYSKIFAKVSADQSPPFLDVGFSCEAQIPQFFQQQESVLFLGYYLDAGRKKSQTAERNENVMHTCHLKQADVTKFQRPRESQLRVCTLEDVEIMADLYGRVFPTYPFPINDPAYLRETMASHIVYFGIWLQGKLVALSSAEMDVETRSVEMTDFSTLPEHRGQGLATILLEAMEVEMYSRDVATAYTIARAPSFGMNITFARMGYTFSGRLINNTNISGQFEDMNVWYKHLRRCPAVGRRAPSRRFQNGA